MAENEGSFDLQIYRLQKVFRGRGSNYPTIMTCFVFEARFPEQAENGLVGSSHPLFPNTLNRVD